MEGTVPFSKEARPTLGPNQPTIHWYLSAYLFWVKNEWSYTSLHIYVFLVFYVHVTVHRNQFLCNKTNEVRQFHKFILS